MLDFSRGSYGYDGFTAKMDVHSECKPKSRELPIAMTLCSPSRLPGQEMSPSVPANPLHKVPTKGWIIHCHVLLPRSSTPLLFVASTAWNLSILAASNCRERSPLMDAMGLNDVATSLVLLYCIVVNSCSFFASSWNVQKGALKCRGCLLGSTMSVSTSVPIANQLKDGWLSRRAHQRHKDPSVFSRHFTSETASNRRTPTVHLESPSDPCRGCTHLVNPTSATVPESPRHAELRNMELWGRTRRRPWKSSRRSARTTRSVALACRATVEFVVVLSSTVTSSQRHSNRK
ncbi:hypothetical protein Ae201684P_000499 [Aphanomyces euteiches]|uniref:Uncharacterized protein n=1 Tax=Aphanomyces euteiches TaxID=100861 RepID=A0A6G0XAK7_9STRA|nr:hypothetical protein Ae201684_006890 [Aphanomyces euteiches]KAH9087087.1 hypothetical protein Ae201684P_000499 [Aphanomyces euteiches]